MLSWRWAASWRRILQSLCQEAAAETIVHYDRLITTPRQVRDHFKVLCRNRRIGSYDHESLAGHKCCGSLED
jgi:hypothetical protein